MQRIFLGLGSNSGDRAENLRSAIAELRRAGFRIERVGPIIESEAVLLPGSPSSWDRPFLNTVVEGFSSLSAEEGLVRTQRM